MEKMLSYVITSAKGNLM